MSTYPTSMPPPRRWWPWLAGLGAGGGLLLTVAAALSEPTPENLTLMASIWSAGLYTLALRLTRPWWLPRLARQPLRNAVLLGAFNAAVIETTFLLLEKLFGAEGVAAHPNLLLDLLMTMPWYIVMCLSFVKIQARRRFSTATVLFLGGIYELGADGVVGPLLGVLSGDASLFTLAYWLQMLLYVWAFIPVYSSLLLPPSWLIAATPPPTETPRSPAWRDALKPLLWLIPFALYLLVFMLIYLAAG